MPSTLPGSYPVVVSRIQNRRGTQVQFDNLYPSGYIGIGGFGSIVGFTIENFPNVLMPGELALCTDSRRIFMGNINGEYVEISESSLDGLSLAPLNVVLPPTSVYTVIPQLTYLATPFYSLLYSITDSISSDWNSVGTDFSRNGELQITAVISSASNPVSSTDIGTEVNEVPPNAISFTAQYDLSLSNIEILYKHDFSGNLQFNTSSIRWLQF